MLQFIQIIHLEYLVTPENRVESELHRVCILIEVIGIEVVYSRIRYRLVAHEEAVHNTQSRFFCNGQHASEALTSIRIRNNIIEQ